NARVFHLFQPLAPAHGEMPGEFVPRGYNLWLRTWVDDERYIPEFLWSFDTDRIDLDDVPPYAFDSKDEKDRVAALLDKYNHPQSTQLTNGVSPQPTPTPQALPTQTPAARPSPNSASNSNANDNSDESDQGDEADNSDQSEE